MAETVWYYARGEVERGPFTTVQIKALANAGKLRADDLVWKEGMENWTSAAEVPELFSDRTTEPKSSSPIGALETAVVRNPLLDRAGRAASEFERLVTIACRGIVFLGLLCIVFVQGCESLGQRRIAQLAGAAELPASARSPEVNQAHAELQANAFGRGVTLYGGVLFLFVGAIGLATFASASDRWLGIVLVAIVSYCLLAAAL